MRDRMQIELTVGEYHDARRVERERTLAQLLGMCKRARAAGEDWIRWIDARHHGEHAHGLRMADGKTIAACPVPGCDGIDRSEAA